MTTCMPTLPLTEEAQWSGLSALLRRPHVWAEMTSKEFFKHCLNVMTESPHLRSRIDSLGFMLKTDGSFNVGYGFRQGNEPNEAITLSWTDLGQQLQAEMAI